MRIILASQSPRRKELLEQIGVKFEIIPAKGEEIIKDTNPTLVVEDLSKQKAFEILLKEYPQYDGVLCEDVSKIGYGSEIVMNSVESYHEEESFLIIGSDTVVSYQSHILGKPKDEADAKRMIHMLAGKEHEVYTGVTLIFKLNGVAYVDTFHVKTSVFLYPMKDLEIESYVATKEPMDKAGAYAIQGKFAPFIKKIDGDYNTVVGLPVAEIYQHLLKVEIDILHIS